MPQTASAAKKHGADQSDAQKAQQRPKMGRIADDGEKKVAAKRLKDIEITIPIVYGTISFWLGKKASDCIQVSTIPQELWNQLLLSCPNPDGVNLRLPLPSSFIAIYHHLKLYPEDESGPQSTKKPVVVESYDEIVFSEPSEAFYSRIQNHPSAIVPRLPPNINLPPPVQIENSSDKKRGDTKDHQLSQWFMNFSEADELSKLAAARQQVQAHIVKLRRQLSLVDGQPQQLKLTSTSGQ